MRWFFLSLWSCLRHLCRVHSLHCMIGTVQCRRLLSKSTPKTKEFCKTTKHLFQLCSLVVSPGLFSPPCRTSITCLYWSETVIASSVDLRMTVQSVRFCSVRSINIYFEVLRRDNNYVIGLDVHLGVHRGGLDGAGHLLHPLGPGNYEREPHHVYVQVVRALYSGSEGADPVYHYGQRRTRFPAHPSRGKLL